jgi:hypothetical protein
MRWHLQVLHVARKDLRLTGWLILAYAVVVGGATAAAVDRGRLSPASPLWVTGLVVLGMLLCALLVQADSPATGNAFWVSRPLSPLAVFSAKVLVAVLLLLGIPLGGQFLGLVAHDVAARDLPGLLAESALSYGQWLGLAAVLAALTRDLRTFVVALVLFVLGWFGAMLAVLQHLARATTPGTSPPLLVTTAVLVVALLVLAHQYVTRDVRRGVVLAAILAVVSLLLPLAVSPLPAATNAAGDLRSMAIRIDGVRLQRMVVGRVQARLQLSLAEFSRSYRYRLASSSATLHRPDGLTEEIAIDQPYFPLHTPDLPSTRGFRWLDGHDPAQGHRSEVGVDLAPSQQEALSKGNSRVTLQGRIEAYEPRVVAVLPLLEGAAATRDGYSARIVGVTRKPDGPSVEVRESSIASARTAEQRAGSDAFGWNSDSYALVNPGRGEAVALDSRASSASEFALVLPAPRGELKTMQLVPILNTRETALREIDEQWLRGAHLLIVSWAPVASHPVTIETDGRAPARSPECLSQLSSCRRSSGATPALPRAHFE